MQKKLPLFLNVFRLLRLEEYWVIFKMQFRQFPDILTVIRPGQNRILCRQQKTLFLPSVMGAGLRISYLTAKPNQGHESMFLINSLQFLICMMCNQSGRGALCNGYRGLLNFYFEQNYSIVRDRLGEKTWCHKKYFWNQKQSPLHWHLLCDWRPLTGGTSILPIWPLTSLLQQPDCRLCCRRVFKYFP